MSGVVIGGIDMQEQFGLLLVQESSFTPPSPKFYEIDIPGANGALDVTETFGDVLYNNRSDTMVFKTNVEDVASMAILISQVSSFLHGRRHEYQLPFDAGYTYSGRFSIDEAYSRMHAGRIKLTVTADPFKSAGLRTHTVAAQAGAMVQLSPGRGRVRPVFTSQMPVRVIAGDIDVTLPAGSHTVVGLAISSLDNPEIYVSTGTGAGDTTWQDLSGVTWGDLLDKRWCEVMWRNLPTPTPLHEVKVTYEVLEL